MNKQSIIKHSKIDSYTIKENGIKEEDASRIEFIDLIKGICILLIVLSHVGGSFTVFDSYPIVTCFRMPLSFFVSGIFFRSYSGLIDFLIRKTNKLLIPFLFFYIGAFMLQYLISRLFPHYFRLPVEFSELFIIFEPHALIPFNPPIWFLLALYNCCLLFYMIHFLRDKYLGLKFCIIAIIGATGFYLGKARTNQKCNQEGDLHIQLVTNQPKAFEGLMAHYGKFSGVSHYIALIGQKSSDLDEKIGYYGEHLALFAQTDRKSVV